MTNIEPNFDSYIDECVKACVMELATEIDANMMHELLLDDGWIEVKITQTKNFKEQAVIKQWLEDNCKKPYAHHKNRYIFNDEKEASLFCLKWL